MPMAKPSEEFIRRSGHRFNLIVRSLPQDEASAIPMDALLEKVAKIGYKENLDQLAIDVGALVKRGELSFSIIANKAVYWALGKGLFETRKRSALIRLHNLELTEDDLKVLEGLALKRRPGRNE
ncbi:MAG: hypothetical protein LUQ46_00285 [Candidatus Methanomethyliaceae archaeon]|nr:hypothetical protein [Candidatus Methanomethyliaceae archaeon]